ncbi:short-chain dehydrogenase TIC 32 [Pyrus ussuriensis x Pyrus communis]|uniref:Short-chain dehydrogenase TIC 32 n=1 Tax=Pyrus ussuriensis x Pyrus communis TaxID=2448454 RepID=A0A5N5G5C4_9ROSA|nr:short-chain dehydrogenase TIC 32 [Pyrus ussuriensis x Pyrus communis]
MGGIFSKKGASGFSSWSTAKQVTEGIDGTGLMPLLQFHSLSLTSYTIEAQVVLGRRHLGFLHCAVSM